MLHEISTGAQNDLERATEIARKMITQFGMSEKLGAVTFGKKHEEVFLGRDLAGHRNYSEEVAYLIDKEVKEIIDTCYNRAETLLKNNINKLHRVAEVLLRRKNWTLNSFKSLCKCIEIKLSQKVRDFISVRFFDFMKSFTLFG